MELLYCIFPQVALLNLKNSSIIQTELRELALNLPGLMLQDLASNSVKKYYNAFIRWQMWSKSKSISALPADAVGFCLYLALQTRLCSSISAFESAVYGVVWAHQKMCLTSPTSHPMTKQVIKAGRRILGKSTINRKLPLKQEHVRALVIKYGNSNLPDLQIVTLITLGFVGFFRWDDLSQLKFSDLFFYPDHLAVFLEKRKNDQFREGYTAASRSLPCPVKLIQHFLQAGRHSGDDYIFRRISHTKSGYSLRKHRLSYTRALELTRRRLRAIGLNPGEQMSLKSQRACYVFCSLYDISE